MSTNSVLDEFERALDRVDVVSFDVFDTAIVRPFLIPSDLFLLIERDAHRIVRSPGFGFAAIRRESETRVRQRHNDAGLQVDPSLSEIYDEIGRETGIGKRRLDALLALELEKELSLCRARGFVHGLYVRALKSGKRVVFTSDTYYPTSFVCELLAKNGYDGEHTVLCSTEVGVTKKHNGELLRYAAAAMEVAHERMLHVGDNDKSDIKHAEANDIWALKVTRPAQNLRLTGSAAKRLFRNIDWLSLTHRCVLGVVANRFFDEPKSRAESKPLFQNDHWKFGYFALGTFILGLTQWIERQANERRLESVHFLSRDGYLPYRAWWILSRYSGNAIPAKYTYVSRRALIPFYAQSEAGFDKVLNYGTDKALTVERFVRQRFGEDVLHLFKEFAASEGFIELHEPISHKRPTVERMLRKMRPTIAKHYEERVKNYQRYLKRQIGKPEKAGLFDVGRKGSLQAAIEWMLGGKAKGFYVVLDSGVENNLEPRTYEAFLGENVRAFDSRAADTVIYELLMSSTQPTALGVEADGRPLFADNEGQHITSDNSPLSNIQRGALAFVEDMVRGFGLDISKLRLSSFESNYVLANFMKHGEQGDLELIASLRHEDSISTNEPKPLASYYRQELSGVRLQGEVDRIQFYCPAMSRIKGGAERVTKYLVDHFASIGYTVQVLTSGDLKVRNPTPVFTLPPSSNVVHVDVRDRESIKKAIRSFNPALVCVLASGEFIPNFVQACNEVPVPIILSERAEPRSSFQSYWKNSSWTRYVATYASVDRVHVQLPSFARSFPIVLRPRVTSIGNPVFLPSLDRAEREPVIACVARVSFNQKRQPILLNAFLEVAADFPSWSLEFLGSGPDLEALRQSVAAAGLSSRVEVRGEVENIESVLRRASIFAFPSRYEGFPNALVEAMSFELPCVGMADCPGVNELLVDGENGLLAGDSSDFSASLRRMLVDEELRRQLGTAARDSVSAFEASKVFGAWQEMIENVIRSPRTKLERASVKRVYGRTFSEVTLFDRVITKTRTLIAPGAC